MADTEGMEEEIAQMRKDIEKEAFEEIAEEGKGKCPFCEIIKGNIPARKVYEDGSSLAFLDINPRNPGHTLVIPKKHYVTILDIPEKEAASLFKAVKMIAAAVQKGMKAQGISISQSNGAAAGQLVPHMHFHVIPRFLREGPVALEGLLSVKKMPDESLKKIMEVIKGGMGEEEPEEEKILEAEEPPKKMKKEEESEEEIEFDF